MDIQQIKYALAVESALNFTKAAERCGVSQPALTSGVKKLEQSLGGQLFHREGRTTSISQFGKAMLPSLRNMLEVSTQTMNAARSFHRLDQTPLRLGVLVTVGPDRVAPVLSAFQESNPGVDVALEEGTLAEIQAKLDGNSVDAAILSSADLFVGNYRIEPLYHEKYVVMLPPGHPLADKKEINLRDLDKHNYVDRLSCEMRDKILSNCEGYKVDLYARFRSQREDWIRHMVNAGIGFAFMPQSAVTGRNCLTRPMGDPEIERTINLVTLPGRRNQPSLKALLGCIRSALRSEKVAEKLAAAGSADPRTPIKRLAKTVFRAQMSQTYLNRLTIERPGLTEPEAYEIQDEVVRHHQQIGHAPVGWKIGAANIKILQQMGISEPFFGRMLDFNVMPNGGSFAVKRLQDLALEVEVCFRLSKDLCGPNVSHAQAESAIGSVCAAFELTMPRFKDWNFGYLDAISDNAGFNGFVLGPEVPYSPDLGLEGASASLSVNGETVQRGVGANALGGPVSSLMMAANKLAEFGKALKAGDLYLSGSLVAKHHLVKASRVQGEIENLGTVSLDVSVSDED